MRHTGGSRRIVHVVLAWVVFLAVSGFGFVEKSLCELMFTGCPDEFDKSKAGIIDIPSDVVGLSASIRYCAPLVEILDTLAKPPSIVFIVDHSGSMANTDPKRARFTVLNSILDEIYAKNPKTEVGLVVFSNRLAFDYRDNSLFRKVSTLALGNDSYLPLAPLDDPVKGLKALRWALELYPVGNGDFETDSALLIHATKRTNDRTSTNEKALIDPKGIRYGTDISLGFEAARDALRLSKASKDQQFIILLSDGKPLYIDKERSALTNEYVTGKDVPTTFTVWFGSTPDGSLVKMTQNIAQNGYSINNPRSNLWSIKTPGDQLLDLLKREVLTRIFSVESTARTATVKSVHVNQVTQQVTDTAFLFSKTLPLDENIDTITMQFDYAYTDTVSGRNEPRDTTVTSTIVLRRADNAVLPAGMATNCWTYRLGLYHNGTEITTVNETMSNLDVRFQIEGRSIPVGNISIGSAKGGDLLTAPLLPDSTGYTASFRRALGDALSDGILQHGEEDTILLVWRNSDIPLDTIALAVPYMFCKVERPFTSAPDTRGRRPGNLAVAIDTTFFEGIDVVIGNGSGEDTIWYTLDGTKPQAGTAAHRYAAGRKLTINADTTVLTAIAAREGCVTSDTLRVRYLRTYLRTAVLTATYIEEQADGGVDGLADVFVLKLDPGSPAPDLAAINANKHLIGLPQGILADTVVWGANNTELRVRVRKHSQYLSGDQTIVLSDIGVSTKVDGLLRSDTVSAKDGMAPVIASARYQLQTKGRTGHDDTLAVKFSEQTSMVNDNQGSSGMFNAFSPATGQTYTIHVTRIGSMTDGRIAFNVDSISGGIVYPNDGDSIWLAPGFVQDAYGNQQDSENNARRNLGVLMPPFTWELLATSNPFTPGKTEMPSIIAGARQRFGSGNSSEQFRKGTLIVIKPSGTVSDRMADLLIRNIRSTIYDAVGNVVRSGLPIFQLQGTYLAPWDGKNGQGRSVGGGTYLCIVDVTDTRGHSERQAIRLGVKR